MISNWLSRRDETKTTFDDVSMRRMAHELADATAKQLFSQFAFRRVFDTCATFVLLPEKNLFLVLPLKFLALE